MNQWAPDANLHERVERLKRERAERCKRGSHEDPDNSGACINCGVFFDEMTEDELLGTEEDE